MLTRIVEKNARKAHVYWPEKVGRFQTLDRLQITFVKKEKRYKNIVLRFFKLKMENVEKTVIQLHVKYCISIASFLV